ncbi:phosphatase subunit of the trehalose-6-phosphate synthase/phosphatase complex [Nadsonia fulvescens var. elongata DSM 6958]|uniref:Phosphatase subunit of the trehalose-6-phosphate synthase/phosphatase complex n=1 Tax=Nadsonia fulvescens var. elongata DSM 6958 TaxID=857566 RepID=A0A1E3PQD6_9ASCO|nr:phosphatase subunit of the trehalose-6-phosphate synthase/phosphatase complex [Nadsonia fulvescens var. elongata DSM 6958]
MEDRANYPKVYGPSDIPSDLKASGRIINVTVNLPYQIYKTENDDAWKVRQRRGNAALFSSNEYLNKETEWESILVAWTGELQTLDNNGNFVGEIDSNVSEEEKTRITGMVETELGGAKVAPIWLAGKNQKKWRSYSENIIWQTLHYIQREASDGRQEKQWWYNYVKLNEAYSDMICSIYRPGDIIWVHDYYLMLLPQILRMKYSEAYIAFFIHTPFPSSEYFRCLSKRKELLEGILGANLVGTQSYAYTRHFISACTRLLGVQSTPTYISTNGAHVSVDTLPIGINTKLVEKLAFEPSIAEKVQAIRDLYPDKKIIVGRDRLDNVRGVIQKLHGFETFLSMYPEWQQKVVLIQVTASSYSGGSKIERKTSELVAHINGSYGQLHFSPVHHYPRHIARDEYLALLSVADLGLITSVRDGMNTTCLEYVVCQKNNHSPIILSEFSGTAGSLTDAVQVNPWDSVGVAQAINECLLMSDERKTEMHNKLYKHVTTNTVQSWVVDNMTRLVRNLQRHDHSHITPGLDRSLALSKYKSAKDRLFLFDYDGTLTPIVNDPSAAIPSAKLVRYLKLLSEDPKNVIWIISGRDEAFLEKWIGEVNENIGLSAEHGCFMKGVGQETWENLAEKTDMSWQNDVLDVFNYYTERTQGSHVERKRIALTWHYRRADPEFGAFQALELRSHLEQTVAKKYDVEVMTGKANIEVRPKFLNKGEIVKTLVNEYPEGKKPEFIFCVGDDKTDEDMFMAIKNIPEIADHVFPVVVGLSSKMTTANWHLIDPANVLDTLGLLVGAVDISEAGSGSVDINSEGSVTN